MLALYRSIDIVVLPSWREGLSKSLLEAASMSLPIITTNVPGCRHIIQHNVNGILCEPKSIQSLEQAMLLMINIPDKDQKIMGQRARDIVSRDFSEQKLIDLTLNIIKNAYNAK